MAGIVGGCLGIEPISEAGDSVIRVKNFINQAEITFPQAETLSQNISESVSIQVT